MFRPNAGPGPHPRAIAALGCEIVGNGRVAWWAESAPAGGSVAETAFSGTARPPRAALGELPTVALEFGTGMPLDA